MTTAHRPTWKAAVGRAQEGGYATVSTQRSVLDEASHTKLKLRAGPQTVDRRAAVQASLRKLEEAETNLTQLKRYDIHATKKRREIIPEIEAEGRTRLLKQTADVDDETVRRKYDDADEDVCGEGGRGGWSDVDNDGESDLESSDSSDMDSDEEDDDEEAALQAELAKIRSEREFAKARAEAEEAKAERERMEETALVGNPLLTSRGSGDLVGSGARLKRKWNDDVVFRNQARGEPDQGNEKRFINDTVRNDFHKRFLNKFIK